MISLVNTWVNASAGSGKTKNLVDRILKLLLHGAIPSHVLCLTFTNAAAVEMRLRLMSVLEMWAKLEDNELTQKLSELISVNPSSYVPRAKTLYTHLINLSAIGKSVRLQTLHGFCQTLLRYFPDEAGLTVGMRVMDENEAHQLLTEARQRVLTHPDSTIMQAVTDLAHDLSKDQFDDLLIAALQQRQSFYRLFASQTARDDSELTLPTFPIIPPSLLQSLEKAAPHGTEKEALQISNISTAQTHSLSLFLTKDGATRKRIFTKQLLAALSPKSQKSLDQYAETLACYQQQLNNYHCQQRTNNFLTIIRTIFSSYETLKVEKSVLDFDDVIIKALLLLSHDSIADWVFHKLDTRIDHILLDEAQDTSPLQWQIVERLWHAFLETDSQQKTLFVVGDHKQSIYSFQGAHPHLFKTQQKIFRSHAKMLQQSWSEQTLEQSFRTSPVILNCVDRVFNHFPDGIIESNELLSHLPYHETRPGAVTLLPLILKQPSSDEQSTAWPLPFSYQPDHTPTDHLAEQIAHKIKEILDQKVIVPSTGKVVSPGDIMVLMRKRGVLMEKIYQQLRRLHVPVAGPDRLQITDPLLIQDLLNFVRFLSLPTDDYTLACLLKSPFFNNGYGLSEDHLFTLCHHRDTSLWKRLEHHNDPVSQLAFYFLQKQLQQSEKVPLDQLMSILMSHYRLCFISRFGTSCNDLMSAFLETLQMYCAQESPTPQGFLNYFSTLSHHIKRSETALNHVRLMTIHGSKGLESPVVFIADATDTPTLRHEHFLWGYDDVHDVPLFLLKPRSSKETSQTQQLKEQIHTELLQENQRLLYVAMTRAKDWLLVGGIGPAKEHCWYEKFRTALGDQWHKTQTGEHNYAPTPFKTDNVTDRVKQEKKSGEPPFFPSFQAQSKPPVTTKSLSRGTELHKILELLSRVPENKRVQVVTELVTKSAILNHADLQKIITLFQQPHMHSLFSNNSWTEITLKKGSNIKRLDHVSFSRNTIHVIDYKTHIDQTLTKAIKNQLKEYSILLKEIYPAYNVRAFVLWIETLHLEEIIF